MAGVTINVTPHQGRQMMFLGTKADIAIYGGAAGGGKTWSLLYDPLKWIIGKPIKGFSATIFRRTYPQITSQGGLWDESEVLYRNAGGIPKQSALTWYFPANNSEVAFRHMENEDSKYDYQGSQIPMIGFDQLESFTESQFFFMMSRNRSMCGVKPYIRATANPQVGWLADFLAWWIAPDGYADLERIGKIRYMARDGDKLVWGDSKDEVRDILGDQTAEPKSVTFIPASVYDNPSLLKIDPSYISNLKALSSIERERLLGDKVRGGNWKIRVEGGFVKRHWFQIVDAIPKGSTTVRAWDTASSIKKTSDFTVGTRMSKHDGLFYVEHVQRDKVLPSEVEKLMKHTAQSDGVETYIAWEEEGGSSGQIASSSFIKAMAGYPVKPIRISGDKLSRIMPFLAQAEAGNVRLVRGNWNEPWLSEFTGFPDGDHDDQVDSCSCAFNYLNHGIINPSVGAEANPNPHAGELSVDNEDVWH
jgi:predicted phage terminase large subunit-like protein